MKWASQSSDRSQQSFRFRRALVWCWLLAWVPFASGWSQQASQRPKIGVALQGGGAKGLAHVGVLQWFEDHHIPIDYVAGTSMGGLIGGLYATGLRPPQIQQIVENIDWREVLSGDTPFEDLPFRRKEDLRAFPNGLEVGLRHGPQPPGGLISGQSVRLLIDQYVLAYSNNRSFDNLPIPFRCVATDLVSGKPVVFENGSLANALRATMSIPGVFSPVRDDGHVYADGGLLDNLPTDVVKQMGADIVIGVHLTTGPVDPGNVKSLFAVTGRSSDVMIDANELRGMERADILLTVELVGYSTLGFSQAREIIPKGFEAAASKSKVLEAFSLSDQDWNHYLAQRESRRVNAVPVPQFVQVKGTNVNLAADIQEKFSSFVGKPIDTSALGDEIVRTVGTGQFNSLSYSLTNRDGQEGLLITAEEKDYAPPWLKPGFVVDGADPNNVTFTFGGRFVFLDVGGYRSEVRADYSIGETYAAEGEYYHPWTTVSRWFLAPRAGAGRAPFNLYYKNNYLAEYKLNTVYGGADIGYAFDRFSELRFGYQAGYLSASRYIGSFLLPTVSGRTGRTRLKYQINHLDRPIIPRKGVALLLDGGWFDAYPGARTGFPSAELSFEAFHPISGRSSLYLTAAGGSTFGYDRTGLPQFSLGGPTRLAAYGVNEFLTDQYIYGRLGYLYRLGQLPTFLGNGLYLTGEFEVAKPYRLPNLPSVFGSPGVPGDVVAGFIMETIVGPVLFGGSVGESGHQKWFFQLGKIF